MLSVIYPRINEHRDIYRHKLEQDLLAQDGDKYTMLGDPASPHR